MGWELSQADEHLLKWARQYPEDTAATQALAVRVRDGQPRPASETLKVPLLVMGFFGIWAIAGALDHSIGEVVVALGLGALVAFGHWHEQRKAELGLALCELELQARQQSSP